MYITLPIIIFITSLIILVSAVLFFIYDVKRAKELEKLEKKEKNHFKRILHHARTKARSLLYKTTEEAQEMIDDTEFLDASIKQELDNTLRGMIHEYTQLLKKDSQEFLASQGETLQEVRAKYLQEIGGVINKVKSSTESELDSYMNITKQETLDAQKFIGTKINDEFEKVKAEIAEYKKTQLKKIDAQIVEMLEKVATETIGKSISLKDHEKLVLEALEKAKQEKTIVL